MIDDKTVKITRRLLQTPRRLEAIFVFRGHFLHLMQFVVVHGLQQLQRVHLGIAIEVMVTGTEKFVVYM
jgi:hypothetical protein